MQHTANVFLGKDEEHIANAQAVIPRFDILFTSAGTPNVNTCEKPIRLTIECALEEVRNTVEKVQDDKTWAISRLAAALQDLDMEEKRVRVDLTSSTDNRAIHGSPHSVGVPEEPSPNLASIEEMCSYFQECSKRAATPSPCIGFLRNRKTYKHYIYPAHAAEVYTGDAMSLTHALIAARMSPYGIPITEKLRLAKCLALAVLQFHSAPWLREE